MICKHKVNPFPYEFCEGCILNGCYPWNDNPLLLCDHLGGLLPTITITSDEITVPLKCCDYKKITETMWQSHLEDLKAEAELNEECRRRAMNGEVLSSCLLPAESITEKE